jgi:small-conductance mechanosensitive channel
MEILDQMFRGLLSWLPAVGELVIIILVISAVRIFLARRYAAIPGRRFRLQMIVLVLSLVGLLAFILALPIGEARQGQLLSLIGILLSAAIALSSTTFVGNIMAGMMMRALRNFKPGDFIRVGEWFGRVSDRGLFHIEIQTEDRDLTTLPNLFLVTNPVKVIRSSGTIISAKVSLAYDVPRTTVEDLLVRAAHSAGLQDPFVHIMELGDFSVTYRVSGLLEDVKQLLTARSHLHEMMLDKLHRNNIEIVSPTFMNTRAIDKDKEFIPRRTADSKEKEEKPSKAVPEDMVFDKAEEAESIETLREKYDALGKDLEATKQQLKDAEDSFEEEELKEKIKHIEASRERLVEVIKKREKEKDEE